MPRLNQHYSSLFKNLVYMRLQLFVWLNKRFYAGEDNRPARKYPQIVGALQPIVDMGKDLVDTFKPYKSGYHVRRDLLQPLRGLGNIAKGVATLVCMPLFLLLDTVKFMFRARSVMGYLRLMKWNLHEKTSWLVEGVLDIVRGATQIATTPLTWFIKMPLRVLITAIKGAPRIEQNPGIRRLVAGADRDGAALEYIRDELMRKSLKAAQRGQKTAITLFQPATNYTYEHAMRDAWCSLESESVKSCINAFRENPDEPAVTPSLPRSPF